MTVPAKKSLGQNFLKDENILCKISDAVSVTANDFILEIGPGKGALTKYLTQKNCQYVGYEIDERMKSFLSKLTEHVIFDDFLKRDLKNDLQGYEYDKLYVIANIPYYITTPIIEHILASGVEVYQMVLLVQKEVAERFCAKPHTKDYGYFTVYLDYYFNVKKLFDVSRFCFDPVPNVTSAVVFFERKQSVNLDAEKYFTFVKTCFSNKRKTLKNNLRNYNWEKIMKILRVHGFTESVRAEEIPSLVFQEIFRSINL